MKNNFVAIGTLSYGPNSGNAPGAGARHGNRNAVRTREHTAAAHADRARWSALMKSLDRALEVVVAVHQAGLDPAAALQRVDAVISEACAR
jgi:hypothetical protein